MRNWFAESVVVTLLRSRHKPSTMLSGALAQRTMRALGCRGARARLPHLRGDRPLAQRCAKEVMCALTCVPLQVVSVPVESLSVGAAPLLRAPADSAVLSVRSMCGPRTGWGVQLEDSILSRLYSKLDARYWNPQLEVIT